MSAIPKKNRGAVRVKFEFMPVNKPSNIWVLHGNKKERDKAKFSEFQLSPQDIMYSRVDVNYYFGRWDIREQDCSTLTLIKLFTLRYFRAAFILIAIHNILNFINKNIAYRRLRSPLKSKFDIYESLMNSDSFLRTGKFNKNELKKSLYGNISIIEYDIYQKMSQSIDWILDACVEDGEIEKLKGSDQYDSSYRVKGKGIHYFTITKEKIKNDDANKTIQHQQVKIQRNMVSLTILIVVATFMPFIDKWSTIKPLIISIISPTFPYIYYLCESLYNK